MRIPIIIASLMLSLTVQAQTATPVFGIGADGSIETNPALIGPFYDDPGIKNLTCCISNRAAPPPARKKAASQGRFSCNAASVTVPSS